MVSACWLPGMLGTDNIEMMEPSLLLRVHTQVLPHGLWMQRIIQKTYY